MTATHAQYCSVFLWQRPTLFQILHLFFQYITKLITNAHQKRYSIAMEQEQIQMKTLTVFSQYKAEVLEAYVNYSLSSSAFI